jgi:microcompartment protein CcmL/EutN
MNKLEYSKALALIETRGMVGAIEAADAMCKTAQVEILGLEKADGGLVTVRAEGEVAACIAAVEAAKVRAEAVGQLLSAHVIPRPVTTLISKPPVEKAVLSKPRQPAKPHRPTEKTAVSAEIPEPDRLRRMKVHDLRRLARQVPDLKLKGRAVARANKKQLLSVLTAYRKALRNR